MIDEIEITEVRESVFIAAARKCPPSESLVRGVMEILAHFMDVTEPDPRLVQSDGTPVDGWESRTALLELQRIIGPIAPLTQAAIRALRDEVR
jgi:hypothetical protein